MAPPDYLLIDNRSRAPGSSPFDYEVTFGGDSGASTIGCSAFQNVKSVEIKHVIMARPQRENYVVFDIEELSGHVLSLDNSTTRTFAVGAFDHAPNCGRDSVRVLKGDFINPSKVTFDPPLAKLNRLRIRLLKHGGGVLTRDDFVDESGTEVPHWEDHSMVFEIKTS